MKYISEANLRKWILTENCNDGCGYIDERDLVDMEWEKEPFINKPCISTGVCHEDKVKVFDKIIAEIESNMESIIGKYDSSISKSNMPSYKIERNKVRKECISIIDKYRKEQTDAT